MDRNAIAMALEEIGMLLELHGENPFRARAFYTASRSLLGVPGDLVALAESGELAKVRGFGPATADVVREVIADGSSAFHQELRGRTPPGLFECLQIPGLGAKRVHVLKEELGIEGLDDLERAAEEGRVAALKGFGEKMQTKILDGVAFVKSTAGRRRQPAAYRAAETLVGFIAGQPGVGRIQLAGELRRRMETVDGVEVVAAAEETEPVLHAFEELPHVARSWRPGENRASARLADGLELRLHCVPPAEFVAAWVHASGSAGHLEALRRRAEERGLRLDASGLWQGEERIELAEEADLYARLQLPFLEPELREGLGEVEAAERGELPRLLRSEHLRGCFHCHTTYSDGKATLQEMAEAALARGWRYWGVADHSKAAHYAGGLSVDRIRRQHEEVDAWNAERGHELWIFKGIEADILPDGRLDYADEDEDVLAWFDYVVGSVHSSFGLPEAEMTERVIRAVRNPHLTFLGHPTGRLLLSRNGYAVDMEAVIDAAADAGVAIEINSNPARLDMDWRLWRRAREKGVLTAVNPDAHNTGGLADVEFGVGIARKGGVGPDAVVNAWELDRVREFFGKKKR